METINNLANHIPWEWVWAFLGTLGSAIVGSGVLTPISRKLRNKGQLLKMMLVYGIFTLGTGVWYITNSPNVPEYIVPLQSAFIFVMSQPFYLKWWQPLAKKFGEQLAKAAAWDAQVRSAAEQPADLRSAAEQPADLSQ